MIRRLVRALVLTSAVVRVTAAQTPATSLAARSARMSDAIVAQDLATLRDWHQQLRSAQQAHPALSAYAMEKAGRWLDLAQDAYEGNSPDPLANAALAEAVALATPLAAGQTPALTAGTSVPAPGKKVRLDLWRVADSLRVLPQLPRAAAEVAALELSLVRAGLVAAGVLTCEREHPERVADRMALRALQLMAEPLPAVVAAAPVVQVRVDTVYITKTDAPKPAPVVMLAKTPTVLRGVPPNVHFALNADTLSRGSRIVLDVMSDSLKKYGSVSITLFGNTDSRGSAEYNLALSKRRANAVRGYLMAKGVDSTRIRLEANGKGRLKTAEADLTDLARNRRVDVEYVTNDGTAISTVEGLSDLQVEAARAAKKAAKSVKKAPPTR